VVVVVAAAGTQRKRFDAGFFKWRNLKTFSKIFKKLVLVLKLLRFEDFSIAEEVNLFSLASTVTIHES
jgi:hypothetical protein